MILLIILLQSTCFIRNIMEGLIWFVLPSALVIFNDIMARPQPYESMLPTGCLTPCARANRHTSSAFSSAARRSSSCRPRRRGRVRTQPKLIVPCVRREQCALTLCVCAFAGFLGALVTTLLAALWFSRYLAQYQWLVCPRKDLTILKWLHCEPANTFRALPATETFAPLPGFVRHAVLSVLPEGFTIMPLQLHALSFAVRAHLLALRSRCHAAQPLTLQPALGLAVVCRHHCALRRLLRLGLQARAAGEGLWRLDPGPRGPHRPHGLPGGHGRFFIHLHRLHRRPRVRAEARCGAFPGAKR
jgi:hypothetical protein